MKLCIPTLLVLALWAPARAASATILVLGDSLSAGYGIASGTGWVDLLRERLVASGIDVPVVNASVSGETSQGGAARLGAALERHRPDIVVVELGANDALRGQPLDGTRESLARIISSSHDAGARVLLLGMRIPPNYGPAYTRRFEAIYRELHEEFGVALVPFFLDGVADRNELMQPDGLHPTAEAQPRLLDNVWPALRTLLR